ncbi:MAG: HNH endonuclease [Sedimentisphaerales bacterium]|nr:HNH endonuclease [Sedimentisphaerales bacterium]
MYLNFRIKVPGVIEQTIVWFLLRYRKIWYGYEFRRIKLTKGKYAIVDAGDYAQLNKTRWYAVKAGRTFYAVRSIYRAGGNGRKKRTTVKMHRQIMGPGGKLVVDHINHNGLDNRRVNLRCVTQKENNQNRREPERSGRSKYRGVQWCGYHKKWRVRICTNSIKIHIGYYDCEKEAARAYAEAVRNKIKIKN